MPSSAPEDNGDVMPIRGRAPTVTFVHDARDPPVTLPRGARAWTRVITVLYWFRREKTSVCGVIPAISSRHAVRATGSRRWRSGSFFEGRPTAAGSAHRRRITGPPAGLRQRTQCSTNVASGSRTRQPASATGLRQQQRSAVLAPRRCPGSRLSRRCLRCSGQIADDAHVRTIQRRQAEQTCSIRSRESGEIIVPFPTVSESQPHCNRSSRESVLTWTDRTARHERDRPLGSTPVLSQLRIAIAITMIADMTQLAVDHCAAMLVGRGDSGLAHQPTSINDLP